jgi:hypothetical protein
MVDPLVAERPVTTSGIEARRQLGRVASGVVWLVVVAAVVVGAPSGFGLLWAIPYGGVGAVLAIRRPSSSIGWLLIGFAWAFALVTASVDATAAQFADGTVPPVTAAFTVVTSTMGLVLFLLIAVLAIVFPSGRLPAGRWGALARMGIGISVVIAILSAFMPRISVNLWASSSSVVLPNPAAVLPDLPLWSVLTTDTAILPVVLLMIASVVSLFVRFRRATGVERQQLRWITAALGFVVVAVVGGYVIGLLVPAAAEAGVIWLGAIVAFPCVAVAIGIAVLRYRLYEIDRIISRTIGWAVTTALIAAVLAGLIVGMQTLLEPITGDSTVAVAASTLLAFALFQPVHRRVQRAVNRRFNRSGESARRAVESFSDHLRDEIDLDAVRGWLLSTTGQAVEPRGVGLWLRSREAT